MKISLAFQIFNKERWLESLLNSWVETLSGKHPVEFLIVFDACKDRSKMITEEFFKAKNLPCQLFETENIHEVLCNRMMADYSSGDVIVFIQDDNWIYDQNWDDILAEAFDSDPKCAVIGLLAGLELYPEKRLSYRRIEVDRPHKGDNFHKSDVITEPAIYQVDAINRPFATRMKVYKELGGLDTAFCPHSYDDMDYSIRALKAGYTCLYVPFDVLNTSGCKETIGKERLNQTYGSGHALCAQRHGHFLVQRRTAVKKHSDFIEKRDSKVPVSIIAPPAVPVSKNVVTFVSSTFSPPPPSHVSAMYSWHVARIPFVLGGNQIDSLQQRFPKIRYLPNVRTAKDLKLQSNTPVVKDLIAKALSIVETPMLALVNCDIVVKPDFVDVLGKILNKYGNNIFLSGARYDIGFKDLIQNPTMLQACFNMDRRHQGQSGDIFIGSREGFERLSKAMPEFLMGRMLWDNWIQKWFQDNNIPCFNMNPLLPVFHFDHGYPHLPNNIGDHPEVKHNCKMAGDNIYHWVNVNHWKDLTL